MWTFQNNWVCGYGFVLYSLGQILIYCYMGTIIENEVYYLFTRICALPYIIFLYFQKQKLCDLVYETPWYLYDQRDKRMILALLQMCQNFKEIWIGPLAPLNVETGTNVNMHHQI